MAVQIGTGTGIDGAALKRAGVPERVRIPEKEEPPETVALLATRVLSIAGNSGHRDVPRRWESRKVVSLKDAVPLEGQHASRERMTPWEVRRVSKGARDLQGSERFSEE